VTTIGPVIDPRFPAASGWGAARPATDQNHGAHTHEGLDYPAPVGSPVFAGAAGVVLLSYLSQTVEGEWIVLEHPFGVTRYMHLERRLVVKGQTVIPAQPIGLSGKSGIKSSGPHLHFDFAIRSSLLPAYVRAFGTPRGGFGKVRTYGAHEVTSVPAEPVCIANLSDRVLASAKDRGVALRSGGWDSIGVAVLAELATKGGFV